MCLSHGMDQTCCLQEPLLHNYYWTISVGSHSGRMIGILTSNLDKGVKFSRWASHSAVMSNAKIWRNQDGGLVKVEWLSKKLQISGIPFFLQAPFVVPSMVYKSQSAYIFPYFCNLGPDPDLSMGIEMKPNYVIGTLFPNVITFW